MKNTNYSLPTFDSVLQKAKNLTESLDKRTQEMVFDQLNHGRALLTTSRQMNAYLDKYGRIHQAKLHRAYEHIPRKLWIEGNISIVDYGCGQGVAEMVLCDYMRHRHIDIDVIKDITLIDPAHICIQRSLRLLANFYTNANLIGISKSADKLTADDINPKSECVLHIFSNVIDLEGFNIQHIADLLNTDVSHNNIILCVGPFYQECSGGKRMELFGHALRNYNGVYRFETHTDDWKEDYSCQI